MRILYAIHGYKPAYKLGGPIRATAALAERLVRKGHEIVVFATNSNLDTDLDVPTDRCVEVDGVRVWYFKHREPVKDWLPFVPYLSNSIGFLYAPAMQYELERIVPTVDIVHLMNPFIYPTYAAGKAAMRYRKPLVYQQRGALGPKHLRRRGLKKRLYISAIERPLMNYAATLIALTEAEERAYRSLGVNTPCSIIPNGVDVPPPTASARDVCESLGICSADLVILFLGRLHPMKGAHRIIDAFLGIHRQFPNAKLVLAGPDDSGTVGKYSVAVDRAGARNRILFVGPVDGRIKQGLLSRADLFCLPSEAEGFSVAVLEALAYRTAVLISPECNFREIESANAGRITPTSVAHLKAALSELLAEPSLLKSMGANGFDLVTKHYNWDDISDSLISLYEQVLRDDGALASPSRRVIRSA